MTSPEKLPDQVLDEATDWLVALHSGEMSNEQYQQFEQWKAEKPENAQAIKQVEQLTSGLSQLPANLQSSTFDHSKRKLNKTIKNNIFLGIIGLCAIGTTMHFLPWAKWQADYHTDIGQIKTIPLEDGSQLTLASNSYIKVDYSNQIRKIKLIEGEIYIKTAKDQLKRPFIVSTLNGDLEALGTQFSVRQIEKKTKLNVYQHAVAIHPYNQIGEKTIQQGYRAVFDNQHISKAIPLKNNLPYWTQHLLVVENWPLKKVVYELYRYQHGTYFLDSSIENIRVSGVFSLINTEQSLETIASANQLNLEFYSPYILHVKKQ